LVEKGENPEAKSIISDPNLPHKIITDPEHWFISYIRILQKCNEDRRAAITLNILEEIDMKRDLHTAGWRCMIKEPTCLSHIRNQLQLMLERTLLHQRLPLLQVLIHSKAQSENQRCGLGINILYYTNLRNS